MLFGKTSLDLDNCQTKYDSFYCLCTESCIYLIFMKRLLAILSLSILLNYSMIAGGDSSAIRVRIGASCAASYLNLLNTNSIIFNPKLEIYLGERAAFFAGVRLFDIPPQLQATLTDNIHLGFQCFPHGSKELVNFYFQFSAYYEGYTNDQHFTDSYYPNIQIPATLSHNYHVFAPGTAFGALINLPKDFFIRLSVGGEIQYATDNGVPLDRAFKYEFSGGVGYRITLLK